MKKLRLISLFSGYDSQALALKYLGIDFEHYKTCEWAVKSIQACKDLHFKEDDADYSKELSKEELIDWLTEKGISADYNKTMTREQIKRLGETKLRNIYNNIKATHNLVNISEVKGKDLEITDQDNYEYILTYSFPCQDLSLAGKRAGMSAESETRSSLLWQVGRILRECKELECLPDILLMENVPQVHGKKNIEDFKLWIECLNELGYKSEYKDLNTKNFRIPQNRNRCFMVSLLDKDRKFKMPKDLGLNLRLKDILEKEVDEKYYLSDKMVNFISTEDPKHQGSLQPALINKEISQTLTTREGTTRAQESNYISKEFGDNIDLKQVGQIYPNSGNPQAGRIYDKNGLSPCLDTCEGGNRMPKIEEDILKRKVANECIERELVEPTDVIDVSYSESRLKELQEGYIQKKNTEDNTISNTITTGAANFGICVDEITEPLGCASRGRNPENPSSRKSGEHLEQRIEINKSGVSNCLSTVQKDTYVIEPAKKKNNK